MHTHEHKITHTHTRTAATYRDHNLRGLILAKDRHVIIAQARGAIRCQGRGSAGRHWAMELERSGVNHKASSLSAAQIMFSHKIVAILPAPPRADIHHENRAMRSCLCASIPPRHESVPSQAWPTVIRHQDEESMCLDTIQIEPPEMLCRCQCDMYRKES